MQEVQQMPAKTNNQEKSQTIRHARGGGKLATLIVSLGSLAFVLPLIFICLTVILFEVNQWNLPNILIYDRSAAWMNPDKTAALVDEVWNQNRQIHLTPSEASAEGVWLAPAELGYWIDAEATAEKAAAFGRSATPFLDIQNALAGNKETILPVIYFDDAIARETLDSIAQNLNTPAENASVLFQDGTWVALPGKTGQRINIEATLDGLFQHAFTNLLTKSALLVFEGVQPEISTLDPLLDEIGAVLSQDLSMRAYDPIFDESLSWTVPMEIKQNWIALDPETFEISLSIPEEDIQNLIQSWEEDLGDGRMLASLPENNTLQKAWENGGMVKAAVLHEPTTYQVNGGESLWSISLKLGMPMWHILDANPGLTSDNISAGMTLTIPSKNILLPLSPVENKRIVINITQQRMTVFENGQVRNTHIISTGVSDSPTMAGIFQIQTHEINAYASNWDLYMPHFMGIYEAWPGFMNGIHGLPLLSNGNRLWASTLGSPASYGCIILDLGAAEDLYHWADPGVVVEITR